MNSLTALNFTPSQRVSIARQGALCAYYAGSAWLRWVLTRYLCNRERAPVAVLFYHRVSDDAPNDWTIRTSAFERQVRWLAARFEIVSLGEAQRRLRQGCRRPAACITFDDGYADNCQHAVPWLLERRIPFTYFVSTDHVFTGNPFPHDTQRGQPLPPNTLEQVRAMARAGVEIGAHTRTHVDLGKINDPRRIWDEVVESGDELAEAIKAPVQSFAFPYGFPHHWTPLAFQAALERYEIVCSAYGGYNLPGEDARHLQRIHGHPCFARFRNQAGLDPRKLLEPPKYQHADCSWPVAMKPDLDEAQSR